MTKPLTFNLNEYFSVDPFPNGGFRLVQTVECETFSKGFTTYDDLLSFLQNQQLTPPTVEPQITTTAVVEPLNEKFNPYADPAYDPNLDTVRYDPTTGTLKG